MTPQEAGAPQAPTTDDQLVTSGLLALGDLVNLKEDDPQRAKAADAFGAVYDYARTNGVLKGAANPAVADMWFKFLKRSSATIEWDASRRANGKMDEYGTPDKPIDNAGAQPAPAFFQDENSFRTPSMLLPDRHGIVSEVTDRNGLLGGERSGTFLVDHKALGVPATMFDRKTVEFGEMLTNPATMEDGKRWVRVGGGKVELPDLSAQRDEIRQFLAGDMPGTGGFIAQNDLALGLVKLRNRFLNNVFGREVSTAEQAFLSRDGVPSVLGKQPGIIPFFHDNPELSFEAMQDPAHMRAFLDIAAEIAPHGEAKKTLGETVAGLTTFAAEFALAEGASGVAVGGPLAALGKSAAFMERAPVLAKAAQAASAFVGAAGAAKTARYIPVFQMSARTALEMGTFEGFRAAVVGDEDVVQATLKGAGQGALIAGLNLGVSGASTFAASLMKRTKYGGWVNTLGELMARAGESDFEKAKIADWAKRMPSENPDFVKRVAEQIGSKYAAEYLLRMKDMAIVASTLAGFDHAKQVSGKWFPQLLVQDPAMAGKLMIEGMTSKQALANVVGFWAGAAITSSAGDIGPWKYVQGKDPITQEAAKRIVQNWGWELAHPSDPEKVAEAGVMFDKLRRAHPELIPFDFAGHTPLITYQPPPDAPGTAGAPARPTPDFPGGESPAGRSRSRVEEMYSFWKPATFVRTGRGNVWKDDTSGEPAMWLQEGGRYAISKARDGAFRILHADGDRVGKPVSNIDPIDTFEGAVARANRQAQKTVSGRPRTLPEYTTDREPTPLLENQGEGFAAKKSRYVDELGIKYPRTLTDADARKLHAEALAAKNLPLAEAIEDFLRVMDQGDLRKELIANRKRAARQQGDVAGAEAAQAKRAAEPGQQTGFGRIQAELERRIREAPDEASKRAVLAEVEQRLRDELGKPAPQRTAAKRAQLTLDNLEAARRAVHDGVEDPAERNTLDAELKKLAGEMIAKVKEPTSLDFEGVAKEIKRRNAIYQRHRTDADKVGLSPEEVVAKAEQQREAAKTYRSLAKTWGAGGPVEVAKGKRFKWTESGVKALLEGAPARAGRKESGLDPVPLERAHTMTPEQRATAAASRASLGRSRRATDALKSRYTPARSDLATIIRANGGLRWDLTGVHAHSDVDFEGLAGLGLKPAPGLSPLVQKRGNGKGMTVEDAVQTAKELGYIPNTFETGFAELNEALMSERMSAVDNPDAPAAEQAALERAQAEAAHGTYEEWLATQPAGLPGAQPGARAVDASSRMDIDAQTRLLQAGEAATAAREVLEEADVLDPWEPKSSVHSATMLRRLAIADPKLLDEMRGRLQGGDIEVRIADAVNKARAAQAYFQQAVLKHADAIGRGGEVNAYLWALDDLAQRGHLTDKTRSELKANGLLDEHGGLHESAAHSMAMLAQDAVWDAAANGPPDVTYLFGGVNPGVMLAPMLKEFGDSPWNPFRNPSVEGNEFIAAKLTRAFARTLEKLGEGKGPRVLVWANRELTMMVGRYWSAAGMPRWMKEQHFRVEQGLKGTAARERAHALFESNWFLSKMRVDGKKIPKSVSENLLRLIEARYFADGKITGPEDLAKHLGPQYGGLYYETERFLSVQDEIGQSLVDVGYLAPEQFAKLKHAYVRHSWLKVDKETVAEAVERGNVTTAWIPTRDMGRVTDPVVTTQIRNWDPDVVVHGGVSREARELEAFRWMHGLANMDYGFAFHADELQSRNERGNPNWSEADLHWLEAVAVDPARIANKGGRDPITGRKPSPGSLERGAMFAAWRQTMQTEEQWRSGSPLLKGQHPYTPAKVAMLEALMPIDGTPGIYVTRDVGAQLAEVLRELTYHPHTGGLAESMNSSDAFKYMTQKIDEASRFWRKSRTIQRLPHWWRNIVSSVMTNHQTGGVPMWDFVKSTVTGQGRYADSIRRMNAWERWMKEGRPTDEAKLAELGLLDYWRNGHIKQADRVVSTLGEGTFHKTLIDTGAVSAMLGSAASREETRAYVEARLKDAQHERRDPNSMYADPLEVDQALVDQLTDSMAEQARRAAGGIGQLDESIVKGFQSIDAAERIRALATHGAQYQSIEVMFKYANTLHYLEHNPQMTLDEAIARGAKGTADYRDTSPALRRWSTQFNFSLTPGEKDYDKGAGTRRMGRFLFASPFMMYGSTIRPTQIHSAFAYPLRTGAVAAMWTVAAAATTYAAGYTLDQMLEAVPGTPGFQGQRVIPSDDLKRYAEMFGNVPYAAPALSPHLSPADRQILAQLIPRVMANMPYVSYGPAKSGASQLTDFGSYAAPVSGALDFYRDAKNFPAMSSREKAEAIYRTVSGMGFETLAATIQQMGLAIQPKPGQTKAAHVAEMVETISKNWAALGNPVTSVISPEAQRVVELGFADGQPLQEWLNGKLDPFAKGRSANSGAMQAAWASTFGERREPSYNELQTDDGSIVKGMLDQVMPQWDKGASSKAQSDTLRIARGVRDEIALILQATYDYYRSRPSGVPFHDLLKGQLDLHRDLRLDGGTITVTDKPQTTLGKYLAGLNAEDRSVATNTMFNLLRSKAFKSETIPAVLDAAAARRIDPALLYRVYKAALAGGTGAVLGQMYRELRPDDPSKGNFANLPEWYDIFTKSSAPTRGTEGYKQWNELRVLLRSVANGDIHMPDAPPITQSPRKLQDMGNPDLIETLPQRWARERRKQ